MPIEDSVTILAIYGPITYLYIINIVRGNLNGEVDNVSVTNFIKMYKLFNKYSTGSVFKKLILYSHVTTISIGWIIALYMA